MKSERWGSTSRQNCDICLQVHTTEDQHRQMCFFIYKRRQIKWLSLTERTRERDKDIMTFFIHNAPLLLSEAHHDWANIQTYFIRGNNRGKWRSWSCWGGGGLYCLCVLTDYVGTFNRPISAVWMLFHLWEVNGLWRLNWCEVMKRFVSDV